MRILLLSAYHAESHKQWTEGLIQNFPEHNWTILTLPARYFSWRIRGNSLTWAYTKQDILTKPYDLILATSMVDLSSLRGMSPALTKIPTIVYFHENQFYYPISDNKQSSDSKKSTNNSQVEAQLTSIYSALSADVIIFNTQHNRDTFLAGAEKLLKKLPDGVPPNITHSLYKKAQLIPVPIDNELFTSITRQKDHNDTCFTVVWNHRWEYDKGPDRLLSAIQKIRSDTPLKFHILGQQFRNTPPEFDTIKEILIENNWLGEWGYIEKKDQYVNTLRRSNAVLSTALHDFQGISILEAVATGCIPIVPNRLAYQSLFSGDVFYPSHFDPRKTNTESKKDIERESIALANKLEFFAQHFYLNKENIKGNYQNIDHLSWKSVKRLYDDTFKEMMTYNSND